MGASTGNKKMAALFFGNDADPKYNAFIGVMCERVHGRCCDSGNPRTVLEGFDSINPKPMSMALLSLIS